MSNTAALRHFAFALFTVLTTEHAQAQQLVATPYEPTGIYALGRTVGWTVAVANGQAASAGVYSFVVKENGGPVIRRGTLDLARGPAKIETSLNTPGMVRVEIRAPDGATQPFGNVNTGGAGVVALGAAVDPTHIRPVDARPADFDDFWAKKIAELARIPMGVQETVKESGSPDVDYATVRLNNIGGAHVYAQVAKPHRDGKFPALVIFQYASPPYPLPRQWVTDRAKEGWLALNVEPHDVPSDMPAEFYASLPQMIKEYQKINASDRDHNYFLQMYLGDYRAVEYLASRPDWDGHILVATGISMGGQQSLAVAGLNRKVSGIVVDVPAGSDANAALHARMAGYPNWDVTDPRVAETARYFDVTNFASRIKVPTMAAMGFIDEVTPAIGIWTSFNLIDAPKEAVPMIDSPHNHQANAEQQLPWVVRSTAWLNALRVGAPPPVWPLGMARMPKRAPVPADKPSPRTDANSMLAHEQLLAKAKAGRIDIYFMGNSITRRWGATDYPAFLANWTENFHGWNAGDFGWGADRIENMLWRIEHGELDGVNPKIIVLDAGTNNVGDRPGDDAKVADITRGIKALIDICHAKAPAATIILNGIFPRGDGSVNAEITRINENIARFANGSTIRYVNINDKFGDSAGRPFDGLTVDKLHPTVKGYQIWADALKPIFREILGPPSATDLAPPPTGDPSAKPKPAP